MFATRNHDENAIHHQQTAAAAKPLNQGVKGLAPKTPGNKRANDENAAFQQGKTGGKAEKNAFVTPAGPRNRAPLGAKTTNAKAFQTPAPPSSIKASAKPTSPRLRRAKVKIHTTTEDPLDHASEEEREIEYMPPREIPLPDYPDDCWPHDRTYPQFEGKNLTRGWAAFMPQKVYVSDEELSDFEEKCQKAEEARKVREDGERKEESRMPGTVRARGAASALSAPKVRVRSTPGFAAPTAAAKARQPLAPVSKEPASSGVGGVGNARHTAARAASNTTLGYSKGRAVSGAARKPCKPLSSMHEPPPSKYEPSGKYEVVKKPSPKKTLPSAINNFDALLELNVLKIGEEDVRAVDLGFAGLPALEMDDELEDFQLEAVEF